MTTTPEGQIKRAIRAVLRKYDDRIYVFMPVPGGYGASSLDYIGFAQGRGFAIEAKKPRGKPTTRQEAVIEKMRSAGARVFIINGPEGLAELDQWLAATITVVVPPTTGSEPNQP